MRRWTLRFQRRDTRIRRGLIAVSPLALAGPLPAVVGRLGRLRPLSLDRAVMRAHCTACYTGWVTPPASPHQSLVRPLSLDRAVKHADCTAHSHQTGCPHQRPRRCAARGHPGASRGGEAPHRGMHSWYPPPLPQSRRSRLWHPRPLSSACCHLTLAASYNAAWHHPLPQRALAATAGCPLCIAHARSYHGATAIASRSSNPVDAPACRTSR